MIKYCFTLFSFFVSFTLIAQGDIDHIKNQPYLKYRDRVNCDDPPGDNLSARICANLAYQKSDSLLTLIYDSLLLHADDSLSAGIKEMQLIWRNLRDKQCGIVSHQYEESSSGHLRGIAILQCLTELTCDRIKELRQLYFYLFGN